jgi:hypothetical protein
MALIGRLSAVLGALLVPLALSMPFVGLKNQPDDTTVYKDLTGWTVFGAADVVLVVLAAVVIAASLLALEEEAAVAASVVAFGCALAAVTVVVAECVSPRDVSEDIEALRYGANALVVAVSLQGLGGALLVAGAIDERIDRAVGLR